MRVLEVLWSWLPGVLGSRRFGGLVRGVMGVAVLVGLVVPGVRTAVFGWLVAQEVARVEPLVRVLVDTVVHPARQPGRS